MVSRLKEEVDTIVNSFYSSGFDGELMYVDSVEQVQELEAPVTIVNTAPNFPPKEPREMLARKTDGDLPGEGEEGLYVGGVLSPKAQDRVLRAG